MFLLYRQSEDHLQVELQLVVSVHCLQHDSNRISCLLGVVSFVDARDDLDSLDEEDASCCLMANRAGGLRFGLSEEKSNSISVLSNNDDPNKHYQNQLLERLIKPWPQLRVILNPFSVLLSGHLLQIHQVRLAEDTRMLSKYSFPRIWTNIR